MRFVEPAVASAVVAACIDARTPGSAFGTVVDAACTAGVHAASAHRLIDRFGRDLADAARLAGWDGLAVLFCNLDPDVAESEAEAWPRVRRVIGSAGFGLAAARMAVLDEAMRTAVLRSLGGDTYADAERCAGVGRSGVRKASLRLMDALRDACEPELRAAACAESAAGGEPSSGLVRLVGSGLAAAGRDLMRGKGLRRRACGACHG